MVAPDQRIDLAGVSQFVQVGGELFQRVGVFLVTRQRLGIVGKALFFRFLVDPGNTVRQVVGDVEPFDIMLVEQVDGVRILFRENRYQYVGARHFAVAGRLHVEQCALQHALEAERGLGIAVLVGHQQGRILVDEDFELGLEQLHVGAAGLDHRGGGVVVGQHQ